MRYFKYDGPWADTEALKQQYGNLSTQARRQRRKVEWLHKLGTAVFWLAFGILFISLLCLIFWIMPDGESGLLEILSSIGSFFLAFIALIISAVVGAVAAAPLWGRHEKAEKTFMRQALSSACNALREYYGFQEPFLVTKCYHSSDKRFDRHDVCIFVANDELRVTANLHYGFFDPKRDLGCYCLTRQESILRDSHHKDRPAVELQAGDVTFCLGSRAKAFIEKHLS